MQYFSETFEKLVGELSLLPGVGRKSAARLAFYIVNEPKEKAEALSMAIKNATENLSHCKYCCTITDKDICPICIDVKRDHSTIMVVENERDLYAYEKSGTYRGLYHVLMGVISPMKGIGPDELTIKKLMTRLNSDVSEVILATNSSIEGETTAMYIAKLIKPFGIKTTRLASGVPVGGDIENIDEITLDRAYKGRVEI